MRRLRSWILAPVFALSACWPQHKHVAVRAFVCPRTIEIQEASYTGVLFPAECWETAQFETTDTVYGYWTASAETIAAAERALRPALEAARPDPAAITGVKIRTEKRAAELTGQIGNIVDRLDKYRRQYLGVTMSDGAQRLIINFFPTEDLIRPGAFPSWKQQWVTVDGGGFWYWQIVYDVRSGKFGDFRANGNA